MYSQLNDHLATLPFLTRIPSKKEESWRFSPLHKYLEHSYFPAKKPKSHIEQSCANTNVMYFVDGYLMQHHLPDSVHIHQHQHSLEMDYNPFCALASHATPSKLELNIFDEVDLDIYFDYSDEILVSSSINIIIQKGIKAHLFLHFNGAQKSFINHVTHIKLDPYAQLILTQEKDLNEDGVLLSQDVVHLDEHAKLDNFNLLRGGAYVHHFLHSDLHYNSSIQLNALLCSKKRQTHILNSRINHLADKSHSDIRCKEVLYDESKAVFDANTMIAKHTHNTKAHQSSKALLLSKLAQIHSKPHLEIYCDDLKASHGSTVGELDKTAIEYLQMRGLSYEKAKEMLIHAFIADLIHEIPSPRHQNWVLSHLGVPL